MSKKFGLFVAVFVLAGFVYAQDNAAPPEGLPSGDVSPSEAPALPAEPPAAAEPSLPAEPSGPAASSASGDAAPAPSAAASPEGEGGSAPAAPAAKSIEQQRLDTLRLGTETEIAGLIQVLKSEKISSLDDELIDIAQKTRNRSILAGIFGLFGEMEKNGLEDRAVRAIKERDDEANETVMAAVDYLGRVRAKEAVAPLEELINAGENRFLNASFRALGRAGRADSEEAANSPDNAVFFLLDYYRNRNPGEEYKREIIVAVGETGSKAGVSFLAELAVNSEERAVLRMAALEAIGKIGDSEGLDAVVEASSSTDPNVRASAIAALGPFSGEAAEDAILEGFRDSYYRTRIGSAQAAGARKLESAVPYLRYRAENDDVPAVKDAAIRALGAIRSAETVAILDSLFSERKNPDRVRLLAAGMLIENDADTYGKRVGMELDEAKNRKQTPLYNGFIRVLTAAKSGSLEDLARRLLAGGGVIEKSLALDLILNNEFRGMASEVRLLLDEKKNGASLARKARNALEKLGLEAEAPGAPPAEG